MSEGQHAEISECQEVVWQECSWIGFLPCYSLWLAPPHICLTSATRCRGLQTHVQELFLFVTVLSMQGIMAAEAYWHWYDKLIISLAVSMLSPAVLTWAVFTGRSNDKKAMKNGHFPKQAGMCGLGESYDVEMWYLSATHDRYIF